MSYIDRTSRRVGAPAWSAAMLAVVLAGCSKVSDDGGAGVMVEGRPLVASRIVERGPVDEPGAPIDLYRALDLAQLGDSIAVVDNGNDRIVLLDGSLRLVWSSGRSGEGPGEFEAPFAVRASTGGLLAIDVGNGRFTELDRAGNALRTVKAPHHASSFGQLADGTIVMPARLPSHYVYLLTEAGSEAIAPRDTINVGPGIYGERDTMPLVTVTAGDTIHVFDDATLMLHKFDAAGALAMRLGMPVALADSVLERSRRSRDALEKQGLHVLGGTQAKDLRATADDRLLLLVASGLTAGFVIDPHTYEARRIVMPENTTEWAPLKKASSALLSGSRLTVLSGDSLYVYDLKESGT